MEATLWIITGETASGKTEIGFNVAKEIQGEIISADSMLIYRGMDVGTAKPSLSMRQAIPHHLIDIIDPWEDYSVGRYVRDAESVISRLCREKKEFVIVGGTPLYIKGIFSGIFSGPEADWELRDELDGLSKKKGNEYVHNILKEIDPVTAQKLHPNDQRRIIRAIEVFKKTNKQISFLHEQYNKERKNYDFKIICIARAKEDIHRRIDYRTEKMFENGFVDEVRSLFNSKQGLSTQASQALGYKEVVRHLKGEIALGEAKEAIKLNTRRFSKRQRTWFRSFPNIHWLEVKDGEDPGDISGKIKLKIKKYVRGGQV